MFELSVPDLYIHTACDEGEGDNGAGEGVCEPCENGFYSNGGTTCHYCGDNTESVGEIVARSRDDCSKTYVTFFTIHKEANILESG